jgi:hypothetical protein
MGRKSRRISWTFPKRRTMPNSKFTPTRLAQPAATVRQETQHKITQPTQFYHVGKLQMNKHEKNRKQVIP